MSAGRLYDKVGDKAKAKIVFVVGGTAVCRITDEGLEKMENFMDTKSIENNGK